MTQEEFNNLKDGDRVIVNDICIYATADRNIIGEIFDVVDVTNSNAYITATQKDFNLKSYYMLAMGSRHLYFKINEVDLYQEKGCCKYTKVKCECGATKTNSNFHSSWCPMKE